MDKWLRKHLPQFLVLLPFMGLEVSPLVGEWFTSVIIWLVWFALLLAYDVHGIREKRQTAVPASLLWVPPTFLTARADTKSGRMTPIAIGFTPVLLNPALAAVVLILHWAGYGNLPVWVWFGLNIFLVLSLVGFSIGVFIQHRRKKA